MKIKTKLISLFIFIKVVPLLLISYIAIESTQKLAEYFEKDSRKTMSVAKNTIEETAQKTIKDAIDGLDKKSQESIERLTLETANRVAEFLYERDNDIRHLSTVTINQRALQNFYDLKSKPITAHAPYIYDATTHSWKATEEKPADPKELKAKLKDNAKEFHQNPPPAFNRQVVPLYKEISFFTPDGQEQFKVSSIDARLKNIAQQANTYCRAEEYYQKSKTLKKGEIYVSSVIGEYVGSKLIGTFTQTKAKKLGIPFAPQNHAYAGKENPVGKKFDAIVRFVTPVYKHGRLSGYLTLALDHRHLMEFTDYLVPTTDAYTDISDASIGNYAFMWDQHARCIAHPRDYFIVGYDPKSGKMVPGWISRDIAQKFQNSKEKDLAHFLQSYPLFEAQSLDKKPNLMQLQAGEVGLDCRYLNFAPQCQGWMRLTNDGGYGSFIIFWSGVWKLTTAATIPYFTGQYGASARGFGFVTIGANVNEFHEAANATMSEMKQILQTQNQTIEHEIKTSQQHMFAFITKTIQNLTLSTFIMLIVVIIIAILISNSITAKLHAFIDGTKKFSKNDFSDKIQVESNDEIGELADNFNTMADSLSTLINEQKQRNQTLQTKIDQEVVKSRQKDELLMKQSRFAALGDMTSMLAHQWRQPLSRLSLGIQDIKDAKDYGELDDAYIDKFEQAAMTEIINFSKTIDDFSSFFKPEEQAMEFDLQETLYDAAGVITDELNHLGITLQINTLPNATPSIFGYKNEFINVVLSILVNAKEAIIKRYEEGMLNQHQGIITVQVEKHNDQHSIAITDNGGEIPLDIIDRVFDPYFSTKDQHNATGLGLYMSKIIIEKNMHGQIDIQNIQNGVRVTITI